MKARIDIPAVVMSLARSSARRAHMKQQLKDRGLNYHFATCADGSNLRPQELALYDQKASLKWPFVLYGHSMSYNYIASSISHLRACEWIVKENHPRALILEDDVSFTDEFFIALSTLDEWAPRGWDMINFFVTNVFLGAKKNSSIWMGPPLYALNRLPSHQLVRCVVRHRMGACYLLTLAAAKRLLKVGYPIRMPPDMLLGTLDLNRLKIYTLFPDLVWSFEFSSDILQESPTGGYRPAFPKLSIWETIGRDMRYVLQALYLVVQMNLTYPAARKVAFSTLRRVLFLLLREAKGNMRTICANKRYRAIKRLPLSWRLRWRRLVGSELKDHDE